MDDEEAVVSPPPKTKKDRLSDDERRERGSMVLVLGLGLVGFFGLVMYTLNRVNKESRQAWRQARRDQFCNGPGGQDWSFLPPPAAPAPPPDDEPQDVLPA